MHPYCGRAFTGNDILPVLHGDDFFFELFRYIDKLQSFFNLTPHGFHLSLHCRDRPFCLLKLGLLGINLR